VGSREGASGRRVGGGGTRERGRAGGEWGRGRGGLGGRDVVLRHARLPAPSCRGGWGSPSSGGGKPCPSSPALPLASMQAPRAGDARSLGGTGRPRVLSALHDSAPSICLPLVPSGPPTILLNPSDPLKIPLESCPPARRGEARAPGKMRACSGGSAPELASWGRVVELAPSLVHCCSQTRVAACLCRGRPV